MTTNRASTSTNNTAVTQATNLHCSVIRTRCDAIIIELNASDLRRVRKCCYITGSFSPILFYQQFVPKHTLPLNLLKVCVDVYVFSLVSLLCWKQANLSSATHCTTIILSLRAVLCASTPSFVTKLLQEIDKKTK